ncbi:MAG: Spy/CpxP family protein refolding chaperone [Pseudomonadota bacterium]
MKTLKIAAALVASLAVSTHALAEDDRAAMAQEQMQQTFERLDLTDEQIDQVKPVLEASAEEREKIMSEYGMDPESGKRPGMRKMRAMKQEMDSVQEKTIAELKKILTDEQITEFQQIQEERQAAMRDRMRGG